MQDAWTYRGLTTRDGADSLASQASQCEDVYKVCTHGDGGQSMLSCYDVAQYFLAKADEDAGDLMSNLKLQKLVYYA
jgi:hypothetical protein